MTNFMRMLKAFVIGMGILIVIGTTVIVIKLAERGVGDSAAGRDGSTATATVALPAGARVLETALDGHWIAFRIALAGGGERVLIFDTSTGRRATVLDLVEERLPEGGAKAANP